MKKVISLISAVFMLSLTSYAKSPIAEGNTHSCLGTFVVENSIKPIVVDGRSLTTYTITYENSEETIRIGIDDSDRKCTKYLVVSGNLSIQYDCNSKYFGVEKLDRKYHNDGFKTSDLTLDREQFFHQKILTQNKISQIDQVKLISVFFPKLVKDYEQVFAVK
jgi:hypothetical protein